MSIINSELINICILNNLLYKSEVDVAVLLLFFTRTDITVRTFEQIRKARPSRLYLYQDGPRKGRQDDVVNIKGCREAVESKIDWECEVHRNYQEKNFGCDPSEYISQKWMFETEDKGIIIEDDDVMSVSFFRFCKELLDKYENDPRVNIICGMNHLGVYEDCPYDYMFVRDGGSIWGWATWKRVIDQWDPEYKFLNDSYAVKCMRDEYGKERADKFIATCKRHKAAGKEYYESLNGSMGKLFGNMNIVPVKNMTCNIGVSVETTHSVNALYKLPLKARRQLFMKTYEYEFPLKHPSYMQHDEGYWNKVLKRVYGARLYRLLRLNVLETVIYRVFPFIGKISLKIFG